MRRSQHHSEALIPRTNSRLHDNTATDRPTDNFRRNTRDTRERNNARHSMTNMRVHMRRTTLGLTRCIRHAIPFGSPFLITVHPIPCRGSRLVKFINRCHVTPLLISLSLSLSLSLSFFLSPFSSKQTHTHTHTHAQKKVM